MTRVFLLSPARSGGSRSAMLIRPQATFELARQVQIGAAELGTVFAFCSGLYFRGKLAYARHFSRPHAGISGVQVITPSRGLLPDETTIGTADLGEFAGVAVDSTEPRFVLPLQCSAAALAASGVDEFVLLGSVATGKYLDTLLPILGNRLRFPSSFLGRGDMSRGALLLRCVAANQELEYEPIGRVRLPPSIHPKKTAGRAAVSEIRRPTTTP